MKIAVLLRFPRVERSTWKRDVIDGLVTQGNAVSLLFGESTFVRHVRAAVKEYGVDVLKKRKELAGAEAPRLSEYFRNRNLPVETVSDLNSPAAVRTLKRWSPDAILLLGTGIIRTPVLEVPRIGAVHCHQGYLPDYRGVNTIEWSVYHGHDVYLTTHFVDPGIDTGRILRRRKIALFPGDQVETVRARCKQEAVPLLLDTMADLRNGRMETREQRAEEGRQYFAMHPFFVDAVNHVLRTQTHNGVKV